MAKAYKKLYGTKPFSAADAVAPIPMDYSTLLNPLYAGYGTGQATGIPGMEQIPNYVPGSSTMEPIPNYDPNNPSPVELLGSGGDVQQEPVDPYLIPEPDGSVPQTQTRSQVGVAPSGQSVPTGYSVYDTKTTPLIPDLIPPEIYAGNLPEMGKVSPYDPSKDNQEAKNDRRNFLIGLSIIGAVNPNAVASYISSGTEGLGRNEDKRTAQSRLAQQQQIAEVGRQYQADKDRYSLGASTVDKRNDAAGAYNTNQVRKLDAETSLSNNRSTQDRINHSNTVRTLSDIYKQQAKAIFAQYPNNLGKEAVSALTELANRNAAALKAAGIDVSEFTADILADTTISDDKKSALVAAMDRTTDNNVAALERAKVIAGTQVKTRKMSIEAQAAQDEADRQTRKDIADQDNEARLTIASQRDITDRMGISAANDRAANTLAARKYAAEHGLDPSSPKGKTFQSLSSQLVDENARYAKLQQQITAFRIYREDANGNPLPGNMTDKSGTILSPANRILFDRLKAQSDASKAQSQKLSDSMNAIISGGKASVPRNEGFTTGTVPPPGVKVTPLYPATVNVPKTPAPLPKTSPMHPVTTPAKGKAAVKRAQAAPRNTAQNIAKSKPKPPLRIPMPHGSTNRYSKLSDAEFDKKLAIAQKALSGK